jgi:hypothetical protein
VAGTHRPGSRAPHAVPPLQRHRATVYEILGITLPRVVNGVPQDSIDGVSLAYAIDDRDAPGRLRTQYFEVMGSRAIYHNGWIASAIGPRIPWVPGLPPGIRDWTPDNDTWELYDLERDWSQAHDVAAEHPEKLASMKEAFAIEAARNGALPIGGGLWVPVLHPEMRISPPQSEWEFVGGITRLPEFCAPALGNRANTVTLEVTVPEHPSGVLYALGANSGGLTCYVDDGILRYEYNLFIIQRTKIAGSNPLPVGDATIEVVTTYAVPQPGGALDITLKVDGAVVAKGQVPVSAPLVFTANDCLDIGTCLGSPVSLDYRERAPFPFNGTIKQMHVAYHP